MPVTRDNLYGFRVGEKFGRDCQGAKAREDESRRETVKKFLSVYLGGSLGERKKRCDGKHFLCGRMGSH